ncbi:hypothetical protein SAMN02982996_00154 [Lonsdalea quercina]|uniref:Uncharacterized protein n=1 Tax=Lonsdalea quercina TaxID=71657 RepID=A0A1H3VRK6_9GAMM|nr:hypothetical protein SAMN02982996_00154 [Lonsdalea quercina]
MVKIFHTLSSTPEWLNACHVSFPKSTCYFYFIALLTFDEQK